MQYNIVYRFKYGEHSFECKEVPGVFSVSRNRDKALADLFPMIEDLQRLKGGTMKQTKETL